MSTATIRRNSGRSGGGLSAGEKRRGPKKPGLFARMAQSMALEEDTLHKILTWLFSLILLAMLWIAAMFLGIPAMLWSEASNLASRAGMQVAKVEVHGTANMDELPVYNEALKQIDHSMLDLDLAGLRRELLRMGWVEDARVSRRLPDTLVVDIVERTPIAVWQHDGELSLVDAKGVVLDGVDARSVPGLPLVVGPDANHQTAALAKLMQAAPGLKPMLAGATWVGHRRWDLQFDSGETLALPEGEAESVAALVNFARMDGTDKLLGRGIVRFDMRDPSRFVLRLPPGRTMDDVGMTTTQPQVQPAVPATEATAEEQEGTTAMISDVGRHG